MKNKLLKESQSKNMQIMDEPELRYTRFYKVMPPGEEMGENLKVLLESDADTYTDEIRIEKSGKVLIEAIKKHAYSMD